MWKPNRRGAGDGDGWYFGGVGMGRHRHRVARGGRCQGVQPPWGATGMGAGGREQVVGASSRDGKLCGAKCEGVQAAWCCW